MAVSHYTFNFHSDYGAALKQALTKFDDGLKELRDQLTTLQQMQDGGNSTSYIVDRYGFLTTATADAAISELASMLGKLTTDGSVSGVSSAISQCLARLR